MKDQLSEWQTKPSIPWPLQALGLAVMQGNRLGAMPAGGTEENPLAQRIG